MSRSRTTCTILATEAHVSRWSTLLYQGHNVQEEVGVPFLSKLDISHISRSSTLAWYFAVLHLWSEIDAEEMARFRMFQFLAKPVTFLFL